VGVQIPCERFANSSLYFAFVGLTEYGARAGYKVGRVDQAETALGAEMRLAADKAGGKKKAPGAAKDNIVRRCATSARFCMYFTNVVLNSELNKVYTNGTLVDPELLTDEQAGHIVALREAPTHSRDGGRLGLCILDCATAEFNLAAFEDDACRTRLETAVRQLRVKELVFTKVCPFIGLGLYLGRRAKRARRAI
jgi:DNA mismatch repair protein MSH6